ncbi:MAG: TIGR02186 family protein [Peptococcaceae bacterium]|nr:TIGR02186 family protein [Peptococcaceae bacterium]
MLTANKAGVFPHRTVTARLLPLALALAVFLCPSVSRANTLIVHDPQASFSFLSQEANLTFSGSVDEGCDVIVKITGSGKKVILGKNGLIPSDYVIVDNLPGLYKVIGSGSINQEILSEYGSLKKMATAYSWSEEKRVTLAGPESDKQIQKAINHNEQKGSYRFIDRGITIQDGKFKGSLHIGRQEYSPQVQVEIMAVRDNVIVARESRTLDLKGSLTGGPLDIEKDPLLFVCIFSCLTIITAVAVEEMLGRSRKTAYR